MRWRPRGKITLICRPSTLRQLFYWKSARFDCWGWPFYPQIFEGKNSFGSSSRIPRTCSFPSQLCSSISPWSQRLSKHVSPQGYQHFQPSSLQLTLPFPSPDPRWGNRWSFFCPISLPHTQSYSSETSRSSWLHRGRTWCWTNHSTWDRWFYSSSCRQGSGVECG